MTDRISGLAFLALAAWYAWIASTFEIPLMSDVLGPGAYPQMLAVCLGVFSVFLLIRPDPNPKWPSRYTAKVLVLLAISLVGYGLLLEPFGFPLVTAIEIALMGILLGGSLKNSVLTGVVASAVLFAMFDVVFGLPLPVWPLGLGG